MSYKLKLGVALVVAALALPTLAAAQDPSTRTDLTIIGAVLTDDSEQVADTHAVATPSADRLRRRRGIERHRRQRVSRRNCRFFRSGISSTEYGRRRSGLIAAVFVCATFSQRGEREPRP